MRRKGPSKAAARKGGRKAGKASRHCKGKKGKAFHRCRSAYFKRHAK